ncbi:hypothetical protein V8G54_009094 [Vigna mungo]|uniref:Uncharacterized protein n=1 Tax=Vigna mungo TaxID=3915 RepID=A0AAQ3S3H2_VIGMU
MEDIGGEFATTQASRLEFGGHELPDVNLEDKTSDNEELNDEDTLLQSENEIIRKQKFEAILNLQKENSGLIEPKKDILILPGMYLPQPVAMPSSTSTKESDEQTQNEPPAVVSAKHAGGTSNGPSSSRQRNFGQRRQKARSDNHSSSTVRNPRKPVQHNRGDALTGIATWMWNLEVDFALFDEKTNIL